MSKEAALAYINTIEPEHSRTSCGVDSSYNAAFELDGRVYCKCNRCTLIHIAEIAAGEVVFNPEEDEQ